MSAEPPTAAWVQGKRWEDLIEAATSASEAAESDRDLTPVSRSSFSTEGSDTSFFNYVIFFYKGICLWEKVFFMDERKRAHLSRGFRSQIFLILILIDTG